MLQWLLCNNVHSKHFVFLASHTRHHQHNSQANQPHYADSLVFGARCSSFFISSVLLIISSRAFLSSNMKCVLNKRAVTPSRTPHAPSARLHFGSWTASTFSQNKITYNNHHHHRHRSKLSTLRCTEPTSSVKSKYITITFTKIIIMTEVILYRVRQKIGQYLSSLYLSYGLTKPNNFRRTVHTSDSLWWIVWCKLYSI